jgi:hypothetical protein
VKVNGSRYPRRRFLGRTLAACALPLLGRASTGETPGPPGVRLAVRGPFPQRDLRARAELLSRLQYQGIELGPEYLDQSKPALARARKYVLRQWNEA